MLRNNPGIESLFYSENIIGLSALFTIISIVYYYIYSRKDTSPDWKIYTVYLPPAWCILALFEAAMFSSHLLATLLMIAVFTSIVTLSSIQYKQNGRTVKVSNILLANILYLIIDLTAAHILTLN